MVAPLLPFLPPEYDYRVVFMERDLEEILASQGKMLERQQRKGADLSNERLRETFARQLRQVKKMLAERSIPTLWVAHRDALDRPVEVAARLRAFLLGHDLDEEAMARVVDRDLYRQRQGDQAG